MTSHDEYVLNEAAETIGKLRDLVQSGHITIESACAIGEARAMLQILSDALEARSERAV